MHRLPALRSKKKRLLARMDSLEQEIVNASSNPRDTRKNVTELVDSAIEFADVARQLGQLEAKPWYQRMLRS